MAELQRVVLKLPKNVWVWLLLCVVAVHAWGLSDITQTGFWVGEPKVLRVQLNLFSIVPLTAQKRTWLLWKCKGAGTCSTFIIINYMNTTIIFLYIITVKSLHLYSLYISMSGFFLYCSSLIYSLFKCLPSTYSVREMENVVAGCWDFWLYKVNLLFWVAEGWRVTLFDKHPLTALVHGEKTYFPWQEWKETAFSSNFLPPFLFTFSLFQIRHCSSLLCLSVSCSQT